MNRAGPLAGVTIVDLTRVLAGPFCTLVLADLGARVIKVEAPERGDDARAYGPFVDGRSAYFASLNRGKESIALDLDDAGDRAVFDRLLEPADVLVENFRPGALARKGYGWEELERRHPRLIYAALSGFGQSGPYRDRPAYDLVVQAMGGLMSLTGGPGGQPMRAGTSIADISAGLFTAVGICAALNRRHATGRGSMIDVAMLDCQVAILENAIARFAGTGEVPRPSGGHHPSIAPFGVFAAADRPIVLAAGNDALFARLCRVIGRPELASEPRFRDNASRSAHGPELARAIEAALAAAPAETWLARLTSAGVPCALINGIDAVAGDPQVLARAMLVRTRDAAGRALVTAGNPIKFVGAADPVERVGAPALDADRAAILAELGLGGDAG